MSMLDDWASLAHERNADGTYAAEPGISKTLLREMLDPGLALADARERRFRAPRSLRDVEPADAARGAPYSPYSRENNGITPEHGGGDGGGGGGGM